MNQANDDLRPRRDDLSKAFSQAEDDWRMDRHLSDGDIRSQMTDLLSTEKAHIRQAVSQGDIYVVAGKNARRVHFHDCSSLLEQVDRDRAWATWFTRDVEAVRLMRAHKFASPRMPDLVSRAHVESLSGYVTCQTCSPTLNHMKKGRGPVSTKLTSLSQRHIGRTIESLDGAELGTLVRIVTTVDSSQTHVAIETSLTRVGEEDLQAVYVGAKPVEFDGQ